MAVKPLLNDAFEAKLLRTLQQLFGRFMRDGERFTLMAHETASDAWTLGVSFDNAFCQSPVCAPSRASFLTGRYPRTTRCRQNGQSIPPDEVLVGKMFADAGYHCGLAGKLHLASCSDGKVEERAEDG